MAHETADGHRLAPYDVMGYPWAPCDAEERCFGLPVFEKCPGPGLGPSCPEGRSYEGSPEWWLISDASPVLPACHVCHLQLDYLLPEYYQSYRWKLLFRCVGCCGAGRRAEGGGRAGLWSQQRAVDHQNDG